MSFLSADWIKVILHMIDPNAPVAKYHPLPRKPADRIGRDSAPWME